MTTYFVTRHPGALEWLRDERPDLADSATAVAHFDPAVVEPGDVVIGVLPVTLAAEVCERGGRFVALELRVPPELRGQELTAQQMKELGASLTEYEVRRVS